MVAVLTDEDLLAFVDPLAFGEEAILPGGGTVCGVFFDPTTDASPGTPAEIPSAEPSLTIRTADAHDIRQRDRLEIRGAPYEVEKRVDGPEGLTVLRLFAL